jgi:putative addiction module component (TIGR02574 family)
MVITKLGQMEISESMTCKAPSVRRREFLELQADKDRVVQLVNQTDKHSIVASTENLMSTTDILNAARGLSRDDRIELVQALWDSIADDVVPPIDEELQAELDRRIAAYDADPSNVMTWEEIKRRVRTKS